MGKGNPYQQQGDGNAWASTKQKAPGVGMGGSPGAGLQQPTDPHPRMPGWEHQGSVGLDPGAVGHWAARNRVFREAGSWQGHLDPRGVGARYLRGRTGRILSSICKLLC